jgi:glycosyltransferase involved in cell wall biosynthesis
MANAIVSLLSNERQAREFGQRAQRRAVEMFSVQRMIDQHEALYCRLAASS